MVAAREIVKFGVRLGYKMQNVIVVVIRFSKNEGTGLNVWVGFFYEFNKNANGAVRGDKIVIKSCLVDMVSMKDV